MGIVVASGMAGEGKKMSVCVCGRGDGEGGARQAEKGSFSA